MMKPSRPLTNILLTHLLDLELLQWIIRESSSDVSITDMSHEQRSGAVWESHPDATSNRYRYRYHTCGTRNIPSSDGLAIDAVVAARETDE